MGPKVVSALSSGRRFTVGAQPGIAATAVEPNMEVRMELDNHADTCAVGEGTCPVVHDFERRVQVHGYRPGVGATECKIITAALACDHPVTGQV